MDSLLEAPELDGTAQSLPSSAISDRHLFRSFFMGGFEGATHLRRDRQRVDVLHASQHDTHTAQDYGMLAQCGIRTVRDALRWHRIEATPGTYDWSSFLPMLRAALSTGTQVLWDLCHWGVPHHIDVFSPSFPAQFAQFAAATARVIRSEHLRAGITGPAIYCPINEISFWSWVGGDRKHFFPFAHNQAPHLKRQLALASIAAIRSMREQDPAARFVQPEPVIKISGNPKHPRHALAAERHTAGQYEAWDMLAGLEAPELGGSPDCLDLVGVNFYWNNQWIHEGERTPLGHPLHRPLHLILQDLFHRYHRPILITETGAEAAAAVGWLGYVAAEVRQAIRLGTPVLGLCLYPVMDYPGWDDDRHCHCGLIELSSDWSTRTLRHDLQAELITQQALLRTP